LNHFFSIKLKKKMLFAYLKKKISVITKKIKKKNPQKYLLYLINQFIKLIIT